MDTDLVSAGRKRLAKFQKRQQQRRTSEDSTLSIYAASLAEPGDAAIASSAPSVSLHSPQRDAAPESLRAATPSESLRAATPSESLRGNDMLFNDLRANDALFNDLRAQLGAKQETIEQLFADLGEAKTRIAELETLLNNKAADADAFLADNEALALLVEDAQQRANAAEDKATAAEKESNNARARLEDFVHDRSKVLEQEMIDQVKLTKEKSESLSSLTRELDMHKLDLGTCAEKLQTAESRVSELLFDNNALMERLAELRQAQIALQDDKVALVINLDAANQRASKLEIEIQTLEALREEAAMLKELLRNGNSPLAPAPPPIAEPSSVHFNVTAPTLITKLDVDTSSIPPATLLDKQFKSPIHSHSMHLSDPVLSTTTNPLPAVTNTTTTPPSPPPALVAELESLQTEIRLTRQALAEERHRTELLAMELECIPDYIHLYHKERKLLISKASSSIAAAGEKGRSVVALSDLTSVHDRDGTMLKVPRAVKNVMGVDRSVACAPCADCSGRVFVL
ncbi:hypothetical protein HDU98_010643 [Podochytrium sp. JEL0797]|nr:hypothetical protein HDU98_010643 [Podochytrium sp. JEL0797]